jgi:hypothetical protein
MEFIPPKKIDNIWLKDVIDRIDPNLRILRLCLEGGSTKGNKSRDFEKGVTILLSICGLRVVHVGDEYEEVTKQSRHEKYRKTSIGLDIVALPRAEDRDIPLSMYNRLEK